MGHNSTASSHRLEPWWLGHHQDMPGGRALVGHNLSPPSVRVLSIYALGKVVYRALWGLHIEMMLEKATFLLQANSSLCERREKQRHLKLF